MSLWTKVEDTYGMKIIDKVKVHAVHMIRTATGRYCLKKYPFPEEQVRFITRVFSCLHEHGFARAQNACPTKEKAGYMAHNGMYYTLTNWVHGARPRFRKPGDFKKAIRTLAKFHLAADGFPTDEAPPSRIRYGEMSGDISEYKNLLMKYKSFSWLVPLCDEALDLLSKPFVATAVEAERSASAFVHGDYNYPNLIKDSRGWLHLVDFENTSLHARMKDLSHILHRNFLWNGSGMLRWVDFYQRTRPLDPQDLHLLHALLTAPYHVVRNIRIGGYPHALSVIPTRPQLRKYQRELKGLL